MSKLVDKLLDAASWLRDECNRLSFQSPVSWTYNPLEYAWLAHESYIQKYAKSTCRVLFLGMNPGPYGMAQTGVPFGEIASVKGWLGIETDVYKPAKEHPKRPVEGFACTKSEVSGRRLWGLFQRKFEKPQNFFRSHFVTNYCPLVFMDDGARNVTPDKIKRDDAQKLSEVCDEHLRRIVDAIKPAFLVGVGAFAEDCLKRVTNGDTGFQITRILHPSPASPAANRDWEGTATRQLIESGVWSE